jgi:hypothetical protein
MLLFYLILIIFLSLYLNYLLVIYFILYCIAHLFVIMMDKLSSFSFAINYVDFSFTTYLTYFLF